MLPGWQKKYEKIADFFPLLSSRFFLPASFPLPDTISPAVVFDPRDHLKLPSLSKFTHKKQPNAFDLIR